MGSISKLDSGKYRAFARVNNKRKTKVFARKGDARAWLVKMEETLGKGIDKSLHDAFDRYEERHSRHKKGHRWEKLRLERFKREIPNQAITEVSRATVADWRDARLKEVSAGSVRRDMNLLSSVFNKALYEWEWVTENPCKGVSRPPEPKHRERTFSNQEIELLTQTLPDTVSLAFQFALETGLRAGEICRIERDHIRGRVLQVPETKTGVSRSVPLTRAACEILEKADHSFDITPQSLSTMFYRVSNKLGIDATFHDTRHTAATRLAEKLTVLELAKVFGWKKLDFALVYYNKTIDEIAEKLE